MHPINFILTSVAAYSGIIAGFIIAKLTKEELKPGRKYFSMLMSMLLALITGLALTYYNLSILVTLILSIAVMIASLKIDLKKLDMAIYSSFALFLVLMSPKTGYIITAAALIFIYGLPAAAEKSIKKIFIRTGSFIPLSIILYILTIQHL